MANYVAMVRFDEATDNKILSLQEKLITSGYQKAMNGWPPHITIAAYEDADEQALLQWTEDYAICQQGFRVGLLALSILPPGGDHKTQRCCAQKENCPACNHEPMPDG